MDGFSGWRNRYVIRLLRCLVARRTQPRRWAVSATAIAFVALGIAGGEPAGICLLAPPALLAAVQALYPTLLVWLILCGTTAVASAAFLATLGLDVFRALTDQTPYVLTNPTDSAFLVGLAALFLFLACGLMFSAPTEQTGLQ